MKKLTLNKETVRDLTSSELDRVAGGFTQKHCSSPTLSVPGCICGPESTCVCT